MKNGTLIGSMFGLHKRSEPGKFPHEVADEIEEVEPARAKGKMAENRKIIIS